MALFKRKSTVATPLAPAEPEAVPLHHRFGVVHEVDPEFLRYMAERYEQQDGKFVRIGNIVLIAPREEGQGSNARKPMHNEFVGLALKSNNEEFKARLVGAQTVAAASGEHLLDKSGIKDAGRFEFELGEGGEIIYFSLFGWSNGYGDPTPEARQETVQIVKEKLGSETQVTELPEHEALHKMLR